MYVETKIEVIEMGRQRRQRARSRLSIKPKSTHPPLRKNSASHSCICLSLKKGLPLGGGITLDLRINGTIIIDDTGVVGRKWEKPEKRRKLEDCVPYLQLTGFVCRENDQKRMKNLKVHSTEKGNSPSKRRMSKYCRNRKACKGMRRGEGMLDSAGNITRRGNSRVRNIISASRQNSEEHRKVPRTKSAGMGEGGRGVFHPRYPDPRIARSRLALAPSTTPPTPNLLSVEKPRHHRILPRGGQNASRRDRNPQYTSPLLHQKCAIHSAFPKISPQNAKRAIRTPAPRRDSSLPSLTRPESQKK
ncbi:hypothetical protein K438DRAFT_1781886 [Mycena galopus ATCC 62051]|nr:hypothetical protein K438DRAFT_1781886 [Mycena galopus ATCC 62051]